MNAHLLAETIHSQHAVPDPICIARLKPAELSCKIREWHCVWSAQSIQVRCIHVVCRLDINVATQLTIQGIWHRLLQDAMHRSFLGERRQQLLQQLADVSSISLPAETPRRQALLPAHFNLLRYQMAAAVNHTSGGITFDDCKDCCHQLCRTAEPEKPRPPAAALVKRNGLHRHVEDLQQGRQIDCCPARSVVILMLHVCAVKGNLITVNEYLQRGICQAAREAVIRARRGSGPLEDNNRTAGVRINAQNYNLPSMWTGKSECSASAYEWQPTRGRQSQRRRQDQCPGSQPEAQFRKVQGIARVAATASMLLYRSTGAGQVQTSHHMQFVNPGQARTTK